MLQSAADLGSYGKRQRSVALIDRTCEGWPERRRQQNRRHVPQMSLLDMLHFATERCSIDSAPV